MQVGVPIGLLLALTYSSAGRTPSFGIVLNDIETQPTLNNSNVATMNQTSHDSSLNSYNASSLNQTGSDVILENEVT